MGSILERRRFYRRETDIYAVIRNEPVVHPARILDVSAGGMRIKDVGGVRRGSDISVQLIGGETFSGRVAWVRDYEVGLEFHRPLESNARLLAQDVRF